MDLFPLLLPSPSILHLESWNLDSVNHQITLSVSSTQAVACCPVCNHTTHRIHSRYERTLRDLPCVNYGLTILLQVCKFFCLNQACRRRIFTERLPQVALPWARRTVRFAEHLSAIGLALGGAAAARLSYQINYSSSRNTILRTIFKLPLPSMSPPKLLGVDDFAFRKGKNYGTILVDLEQHQPMALLPDRDASTLANWLREHPSVEVLSRDRSKTYKAGMSEGAPNAVQVADRFHLLQNLEEVLEKVFNTQSQAIQGVDAAHHQAEDTVFIPPSKPRRLPPSPIEEQKAQRRARRLEKYQQTHALRQQGYRIKDIAHHLGIGKRTVYTYLAASCFPERQPSPPYRRRKSQLDCYKPYLLEQWNQGHQQSKQLFQAIQQQGYGGTYQTVTRYTRQLRQVQRQTQHQTLKDQPGRGPAPAHISNQRPLSARRAAWLVVRQLKTLTSEEEKLLMRLSEHPELSMAITLAQGFLFLVRHRLPQHLDIWLEQAKNSSLKPFERFAKSLIEDYEAVKAGVTLEVSNGVVEGQNNRLKMIKRQMFGRAGLDLLSRRLILAS